MDTHRSKRHVIGVISDTHGILRTEAVAALKRADLIVHAGDIGSEEVLEALQQIAPVVAVRGNMDGFGWARDLPETEMVAIGDIYAYILHDLLMLDIDPDASGVRVVISGHTHLPAAETRDGILYLNPGSAGHRRPNRPTTIARLYVEGTELKPEIIRLEP